MQGSNKYTFRILTTSMWKRNTINDGGFYLKFYLLVVDIEYFYIFMHFIYLKYFEINLNFLQMFNSIPKRLVLMVYISSFLEDTNGAGKPEGKL